MNIEPKTPDLLNKEDHQLGRSWILSESYLLSTQRNAANYKNNNFQLFEFCTLSKFASLWNHTSYSNPSNLFYDSVNNNTRKFYTDEPDSEEKIIDGLLLFQSGIKPEWEDPLNKNGCSFDGNFKNLEPFEIDQLWQDIVLALIGENFPYSQFITGIRFLDRMKKHSTVKIEIWISVGLGSVKPNTDEYLKNQHIVDAIIKHFAGVLNRTTPISELELTGNEHTIKLKVN